MQKIATMYRGIPDKKQYIEFFTALLSVPVLLTVILINVNNLKGTTSKQPDTKNTDTARQIVVTIPDKKDSDTKTTVSPTQEACKKEIGPIDITYPEENDQISENPVMFSITYKKGNYCAVVWSYRVNNGHWSDYDDKSIALYNLPKGDVRFDLKVKSIVTGDEKILTRNFIYDGEDMPLTPATNQSSASEAAN